MKALTQFFILLSITLLTCCKPDEPCDPPINKISPELLDYMPDINYSNIIYKDNQNNKIKLGYYYFDTQIVDSPNPCNPKGEHSALVYQADAGGVNWMQYQIDSGDDTGLHVRFGDPYEEGCTSIFRVDITDTAHIEENWEMHGEVFENAQFVWTISTYCVNELYYNKQYGIVGFKWNGEWYVLEKDSLQ